MRAETGHGCGLQMILKHNFNQVCSADCWTHHADSRRLGAAGSKRAWNSYLEGYDILVCAAGDYQVYPPRGLPFVGPERRQCRSTPTIRGEAYRSSQKVKDEVSLSGQWTRCCDYWRFIDDGAKLPTDLPQCYRAQKDECFHYSRAHGSDGRRRRAVCKKWTAPRQTRHASRSGDMQAHASRRIKRLCLQPARQQPTFSAFVGQVREQQQQHSTQQQKSNGLQDPRPSIPYT